MTEVRTRPGLMDTQAYYGIVSRILHWAMAALILWQLLGMVLKVLLGRQPVVAFFVGMHASIGTLIFALVLVRIVWAWVNRGHRPGHGAGLMGLAAKSGHALLYALMVAVPGMALLRGFGGTRPFEVFGWQLSAGQAEAVSWMVGPANALHGLLAWGLLVVIGGHVAMALIHQFVMRDRLMKRMA